jgi:hypothetical protein
VEVEAADSTWPLAGGLEEDGDEEPDDPAPAGVFSLMTMVWCVGHAVLNEDSLSFSSGLAANRQYFVNIVAS